MVLPFLGYLIRISKISNKISFKISQIRIKRASESDLNEAVSLVAGFYSEDREADERAITANEDKLKKPILKKLKEKNRNLYFLAYLRGELVGLLQIFIIDRELSELILIYILPKFRRKGIGEFFVKWGLNELKKRKIKFTRIEVRENNNPSLKIFSKFNLQPYSRTSTINI